MFNINSTPPEDLTRYNLIAHVARFLAEGNDDEWSYFLNSLNNHSPDFCNLMLKLRDEIKLRLDGPVTSAEFYGIPSPFGDLPPGEKGDIPPSFLSAFDEGVSDV